MVSIVDPINRIIAAHIIDHIVTDSSTSSIGTVFLETAKNSSTATGWARINGRIVASRSHGGIVANLVGSRAIGDCGRGRAKRRAARCWVVDTRMGCIIDTINCVVATNVIHHIIANGPASAVGAMLLEATQNLTEAIGYTRGDRRIVADRTDGNIVTDLQTSTTHQGSRRVSMNRKYCKGEEDIYKD
jgi:hypothetical protein